MAKTVFKGFADAERRHKELMSELEFYRMPESVCPPASKDLVHKRRELAPKCSSRIRRVYSSVFEGDAIPGGEALIALPRPMSFTAPIASNAIQKMRSGMRQRPRNPQEIMEAIWVAA
jgi:hypothetical protein